MDKVVVFERMCLEDFAKYRDNTRYISAACTHDGQADGMDPKCLLRDYHQLATFAVLCFRSHWQRLLNQVSDMRTRATYHLLLSSFPFSLSLHLLKFSGC